MSLVTQHADLSQECLSKLNRALDLVLETAEAASADKNHKVVIQAAREVTRIVTLIHKVTAPPVRSIPLAASGRRESQEDRESTAPAAGQDNQNLHPPARSGPGAAPRTGKNGIKSEDFILPDLATFFPPHEVASWSGPNQGIFQDISRNYQELQAISAQMAAALEASPGGNGKTA